MIVVDASAMIELLLPGRDASKVADRLLAHDETLHAPHLLDVEVAHVLRRFVATGQMSAQSGAEALSDFMDFRIARYPHDLLLPRAWDLRHAVTAYDAMYVALAEGLGAPLVTRDRRLAKARGHRATVEVV